MSHAVSVVHAPIVSVSAAPKAAATAKIATAPTASAGPGGSGVSVEAWHVAASEASLKAAVDRAKPGTNSFALALAGVRYEMIPRVLAERVQARLNPTQTWVGFPASSCTNIIPVQYATRLSFVRRLFGATAAKGMLVTGGVVLREQAPVLWSVSPDVDKPVIVSVIADPREGSLPDYLGTRARSVLFAKFPTAIGDWLLGVHELGKRRQWTLGDVELLTSAALAAAAAIDDCVYATINRTAEAAESAEQDGERAAQLRLIDLRSGAMREEVVG